jgi:hypothetical protein
MEIQEKIERLKTKALLLKDEGKTAFIEDLNGKFFFCNIDSITANKIIIIPFKGTLVNKIVEKYWLDISKLEEYKTMEELNDY